MKTKNALSEYEQTLSYTHGLMRNIKNRHIFYLWKSDYAHCRQASNIFAQLEHKFSPSQTMSTFSIWTFSFTALYGCRY